MKTLKEMIAATSDKHNPEDNSNLEEFAQVYKTFRPKTWGDVLKAEQQTRQEPQDENSILDLLGTMGKNAFDTAALQAGLQARGMGYQIKDLANTDYYKNNPNAPVVKVAQGLGGALDNFGQAVLDDYDSPKRAKYHSSEEWQNTALGDILSNPEMLGRYLSDPQGFAAEFGSGFGSAAEFAAITAALSKLGLGKVADKVSGKALSGASSLLSRANLPELAAMAGSDLAKSLFGTTLQFGSTMGPAGALTNAATTIDAQKQQGKSDEEIAAANRSMMAEEMPYDVAFSGLTGNVAKGLVGKAIAPKNSTVWQKALANAAGVPLEGAGGYYSNVEQMILADKYSGNPYGTLGNPTPNESAAGRMGVIAGLPFSAYGGVRGYLNAKAKENAQAQNQEVSKAFSDLYQSFRQDFNNNAATAESQARQSFQNAVREQEQTVARQNLRSWANDISGGKMSSEVFESIVRNAQELGVDVKHALAQAVAESNGNQDVTSGAGAIGVMQLMPETARELGVNPDDTEQNIRGGIRYLKQMYDRFGDWDSAHAAYNAGAGAVDRYSGTPPYSETRNYVAKINGYINDSPDYQTSRNEEIYSGENGKGEGKYWQRQGDNVSFEGAQPQLLNAIDALGKFYFENTGKKLVVTAGTNGSHADGEHSHGAGWKVDVNDFGFGEDGALTTPDGGKGWFADEFIKYGQKLGLGMNWEGGADKAHIDVALDGTQWDGSTETKNFGGFNPKNNSVQGRADANFKQNYKPPQETFADRLYPKQNTENQSPATTTNTSQITSPPEPAQVTEQADTPTDFFSGTFDTKSQVISTADKFLEELRQEGDPQKAQTLFQLQRARNAGDVAAIENILKQNNVAVSSPTQETVENNPPPQKKILSGRERLIKVASAPVSEGKDNANKRARQGKALLRLAQQNNIEVPNVDTKALEAGSTIKVQEWRDKFLQAGLFNVPQESPEVNKARRDWESFKAVSQERGQKIQTARAIANNLFNLSEADENNAAGVAAPVYDSDVMEQLDREESKRAEQRQWQANENERLQQLAQQEEYHRWQAKQAKELKELQARQAEAKRLAEARQQMDEQNIAQQKHRQIENIQNALGIQDSNLRNQAEFALSNPHSNKAERKRQGEVLATLLEYPQVRYAVSDNRVINSLKPSLKVGGTPAILKAQEILSTIEAPAQRERRYDEKVRLPKSQAQIEQEQRARKQKKQQRQWDLAQRHAEEEFQQELSQEEEIEKDNFESELQLEDEIFEDKINRAEELGHLQERAEKDSERHAERLRADTRAAQTEEQVRQATEQYNQKIKAQSQQAGDYALEGLAQTQSENLQARRQKERIERADFEEELDSEDELFEHKIDNINALEEEFADADFHAEPTPKAENTVLFERDGNDSTKIQEGRKAIQNAPDGTIIRGWWIGLGVNSTSQYIISNGKLQMLDENGYRAGNAVKLSPANIRKHFGQSSLAEIELTYPEPQTQEIPQAEPASQAELERKLAEAQPQRREYTAQMKEYIAKVKEKIKSQLYGSSNLEKYPWLKQRIDEDVDAYYSAALETDNLSYYDEKKIDNSKKQFIREWNRDVKEWGGIADFAADDLFKRWHRKHTDKHLKFINPEDEGIFNKAINIMAETPTYKNTITADEAIEQLKSLFEEKGLSEDLIRQDESSQDNKAALETEYIAGNKVIRKNKGKWRTIGSAGSREDLQKLMHSNGMTVEIKEDGTIINSKGEEFHDKIRINKGRWQFGYYEGESPAQEDTAPRKREESVSEPPSAKEQSKSDEIPEYEEIMALQEQTKPELYKILDADNYPSIKRYIDEGLNKLQYKSLAGAKKGIETLITQAHQIKSEGRIASSAAVLHVQQQMSDAPNRAEGKKAWKIINDMRDGKITGEKAYKKIDDLFSGRAKEKSDAQRAAKQERLEKLKQSLKDELSQILDLDNHPALKNKLYQGIDLGSQKIAAQSEKKYKEWADGQIDAAKKIRDEGKIDLFEERATKSSKQGNADTRIKNFVEDKDLTPQQKLLKTFGQKLGVQTVLFDNPDGNFHGAHSNGTTYLNVNSKMPLGKVFWHESMHWLKNNNSELYQQLAEVAGITDAQREAYLKETKRNDLEDNAAIDEEIIADAFEDTAKRTGLLQSIAGKNRGLIQRVVQWLKDTMNKFVDTFRNPQGKLTTAQSQALADEFGRIANKLADSNGEKIFRYNNRTKNIELADGRKLSSTETENDSKPKYSIGASDNSDESTLQRIRNKAAAWFSGRKGLSERRNKRIVQRIEGITNYKIAFNGVDETIVDDFHKVIRAPHAYQWEKYMPAVSEKIAHVLKLPAQKEMANYITDWILTGALNNTSAEAAKFQKAMHDDPPTAEALIALRNEFKEITEMTPEERYGEKIVHPQKTLTAKIMEKFTKEEWIDDLAPLQKMIDQITKDQPELGAEIKKGINPLEMARLYRGKGGMVSDLMIHGTAKNLDKIRTALQEQYPNVNWNWFKPVDMIIEEVGGQKNLKALEVFAVAKLDKEIFEWNRAHPNEKYTPTNPNESDADAVIKNGEAQFGQAQRDLVNFSRTLLDIRHDAGLITDAQYFKTIKSWKNYIPMARVFDENEDYGFMSSLKGEKTGSERDTYTPIGRLIINANEYIRQAERNKIKQEIAGLARMGAFAKYIEERDTNKVDAKNHIVFYENGKRKYLQTAPEVVRAVEALGGRTESVMIVKLLHAATKAVTASYTTLNLDFAAGNPFRDLADSYLHNKYIGKNPLPFIQDGFIQIFRGLTGKRANDADFIEWVANGGSQASLVSPDIDYVQRDINSLGTTWKERFRKNPFSTVLEGLQRVAEHGEQAVRLANYRAARDALAKQHADGKATVEDKRKAALVSREASIDFAKAGRSTRVANRVFAFTNAAVQSWNLDYQRYVEPLFTEEGRKKVWGNYFKLGMTYMVPAVLQAALCYGKDWWKEKKDWEKETYWFFGDTIKIPKGLDVAGRLTAAFTDTALSYWLLNEPVEAKRFLKTVKDAMPSLTTTIFTPLVETALNRSWFRQAPIVPAAEQHLPAHLQYGEETSPVAKLFGEQTGVSPRKIDYMINGYFGFLGKFFSGKYFTGDLNELPLVHRFKNVPYKNLKSVQRFYEVYDEQDKLYNGYKLELKRDPKTKPPKELDMALYRRLKRATEPMQRISKQRKLIEGDKNLSSAKREEKLLALEKQRIALCQRVLNGAR